MTCKLCGGLGKGALRGMICPDCGGTGMTPADNMSTPAEKTLLDEFAMAVVANGTMLSEIVNATNNPMTAHDVAKNAYTIAAAMMQERNRRDEMGNVKEATE